MVAVKYIATEAYLCIGTDGVKMIPLRNITQIVYRYKHVGSWVTIHAGDSGEHYFEEPNDDAKAIIAFLKSSDRPTLPTEEA